MPKSNPFLRQSKTSWGNEKLVLQACSSLQDFSAAAVPEARRAQSPATPGPVQAGRKREASPVELEPRPRTRPYESAEPMTGAQTDLGF